jgi:hypothetical protein
VYFGTKAGSHKPYNARNILDVDMNAGRGTTREPVENLSWIKPKDGVYTVQVDQFNRRETDHPGFTLEVEVQGGGTTQYSYSKAFNQRQAPMLELTVKNGAIQETKILNKDLVGGAIPQQQWNIKTEQFAKVSTIMLSPNHWGDSAVGNKHWFFVLDQCLNPEPTRGFYNEFLLPELDEHRKVFELVGSKTKCQPSNTQLSGLGFSSTKRASVLARVVSGSATRLHQINF